MWRDISWLSADFSKLCRQLLYCVKYVQECCVDNVKDIALVQQRAVQKGSTKKELKNVTNYIILASAVLNLLQAESDLSKNDHPRSRPGHGRSFWFGGGRSQASI